MVHAHDFRVRERGENIPLTTLEDLTDADRLITGVYARVISRPGRDASAAVQQVFSQLRANPTLTVAQPVQEIGKLFAIVGNVEGVLLAMAGAVVVSSGLGILLALYNSMAQRRRQIAVLRVLGASKGRVFGLVLLESAAIGALGAAIGFALAKFGGGAVTALMQERLGFSVEPGLPVGATAMVLLGTVALTMLAGLGPALMAYRTAVARNLRELG